MVAKRIYERIGVALLAVMLAASLVGAIAPVGARAAGAPSAGSSAPAAIDRGFSQVEEESQITFEHTGEGRGSYTVTVSGSIEAGSEADLEDAQSVDRVSARRATGSVAEGGTDDFFFTGEITSLEVDGPITVYVDGQQVDPDRIGGRTTTATATETATTTTTTATATATATATGTETNTPTATASATPTETSTPTATRTATATTTETETPVSTRSRATTPGGGNGEGSTGLSEQERDLFLTIGGVLLLGIVAIGGFALLARR